MSTTGEVRGIAWDHPRAVDPLTAISAGFTADTGIPVTWDTRPLKDFEDQPLEELAERYDLVLIDYPFTGTAATSGLIVAADDWVDAAYLADQAAGSVGPSFASYTWHGRQWALVVDAASQVSAYRDDLLADAGRERLPGTWSQVAELAAACRNGPAQVAMPLNPNHAYCSFLSVGIALSGPGFWRPDAGVDSSAGMAALEFLRSLTASLHPLSRRSDPIAVSDRMTTSDEIFYVPLMFGYSSYARAAFRPAVLTFGNAPTAGGGSRGSVLGGVGIALSARSGESEAAATLARRIASPGVQAGSYAAAGGQPGHAAAWESAEVNRQVNDFFTATRSTIDQAFMRPRVSGHRRFQELAGELIHAFLWDGAGTAGNCLDEFGRLADQHLSDWLSRSSR